MIIDKYFLYIMTSEPLDGFDGFVESQKSAKYHRHRAIHKHAPYLPNLSNAIRCLIYKKTKKVEIKQRIHLYAWMKISTTSR